MKRETDAASLRRLMRHRDHAERQAARCDERGDETGAERWGRAVWEWDRLINARRASQSPETVDDTHTTGD